MNKQQINIDYYSDILCVWAWISQRRIDELNKHFLDRIDIRYHYVDVFGDTSTRIQEQWGSKGLYQGFCDHVIQSAAPYETAEVNPDIWNKTRPSSSANTHLLLKAIELSHSKQQAIECAILLRKAFFIDALDISNLDITYELISSKDIDIKLTKSSISNGSAIAALMKDYQAAQNFGIKGSPCFVMNQGRQVLFGNVGFRVLCTNIEELLKNTSNEASWC